MASNALLLVGGTGESQIEMAEQLPAQSESLQKQKKPLYIRLDGDTGRKRFPANRIKNTKYNPLSFVPVVLFNQFKYFYNFFFLLITISQLFPPLQVGFLFTYVAPLVFVLVVTLVKEGYDDLVRLRRDKEINSQTYSKLTHSVPKVVCASDIKVGDLIELRANERIPADLVLLWTDDESGTVFIRTDQLDGETDWKLRKAVTITQDKVQRNQCEKNKLLASKGVVTAEAPSKGIYSFMGVFEQPSESTITREILNLEHTLWASTVMTKGVAIGLVVYTGKHTRSAMNSTAPTSKTGVCDKELNVLSQLLFALLVLVSIGLMLCAGLTKFFYVLFFRFLLLLSSIIPISLRVNLDMAKIYFSYFISNDRKIRGTIARNSNIPEELGRIEYIMTDKTGTLTQNQMVFKKCYLPFMLLAKDDPSSLHNFTQMLRSEQVGSVTNPRMAGNRSRMCREFITALALCHNVTPAKDEHGQKLYQASSPDEVALVKFADECGIELIERKHDFMAIRNPEGGQDFYNILEIFPFSSATKRMGIILQNQKTREIKFYLKGAEDVLKDLVLPQERSKTLEDCKVLATEGLRTLVISQRELDQTFYETWKSDYEEAQASWEDKEAKVAAALAQLESNMETLGITGVEDRLQLNVQRTIRDLKSAGICVWILTGDKVETAECIAISTELKSKLQTFHRITGVSSVAQARNELKQFDARAKRDLLLVIDGPSLEFVLSHMEKEFVEITAKTKCVVCCRVTPSQKTQIVEAVKTHTGMRICGIGDGGNDVGMIQAAHVGIGIEGKEGKQASLAADFSILEFQMIHRLILWHGRNSYKRTAKLSNFVYHRGLVISVIQTIFSCLFHYCALPFFNGFLMLGYATVYTMLPVFSLVLDQDADYKSVKRFPELYGTLLRARELNFTNFLFMVLKSVYQGSVIMLLGLLIFPDNNFVNIVGITFSALIFTELFNVITETNKFHWGMGVSEVVTAIIYLLSMFGMKNYFDLDLMFSGDFLWRTLLITAVAWLPIHLVKVAKERLDPPDHKKAIAKV